MLRDLANQKSLNEFNLIYVVVLIIAFISKKKLSNKNVTLPESLKIIMQKDYKKEDLFKGKNPKSEHPGIVLLKLFVNNLHL